MYPHLNRTKTTLRQKCKQKFGNSREIRSFPWEFLTFRDTFFPYHNMIFQSSGHPGDRNQLFPALATGEDRAFGSKIHLAVTVRVITRLQHQPLTPSNPPSFTSPPSSPVIHRDSSYVMPSWIVRVCFIMCVMPLQHVRAVCFSFLAGSGRIM